MSPDHNSPLVSLNELLRSIDDLSRTATNFLSPVIRFVGHRDSHYDSLNRRFPRLIHERKFSGLPSHLVIFDEIPEKVLVQGKSLSADCAYLFCIDQDETFSSDQKCTLSTKLSMTIRTPEVAELHRCIDTLLMLQGICFSDGVRSYPSLMSVDYKFRDSLSSIINASLKKESCVALVPTVALSDEIVSFLYAESNTLLEPFRASLDSLDISRLPIDRHTLIQYSCTSSVELDNALSMLEKASLEKPIICLIETSSKHEYASLGELNIFDFHVLRQRSLDAVLIAHWCAFNKTFETNELLFYSQSQIDQCLDSVDYDSARYVLELLETKPTELIPCVAFCDFIEVYKRPTIDDIFEETQRRVMRGLQSLASLADAASSAAGIPTVTFRKRVKRFHDRDTFLGLITKSHDEE